MRDYRNLVKETMKDPKESAEYLKASLEEYEQDGNIEAFLLAVKTVTDAQGGISELAKKTKLIAKVCTGYYLKTAIQG